ncbi:hypothetical protein AB0K18_10455 [Nonomuraea sp. NPDC049421]|uniref:hypothetical protein n=1 Tax=Nonomuraea sp. NPDC049421 TaxID=3155275 RepID=UPI0034441ACF
MRLRDSRWTEEQFEEWFQTRFGQWVNDRFREGFNAELDRRMPVWADKVDGRCRDQFDTRFDSRFASRINAWQDHELKKGFDAWLEEVFDTLFTVWANTWADKADFHERFDLRFERLFEEKFEEKLDEVVTARVANRMHDLIDLRIKQWAVDRRQAVDAAESPSDKEDDGVDEAVGMREDAAEQELSASEADEQDALTATAAELAECLAKKPVGPQQIRRLLRGQEIPGSRPARYLLGDAAVTLLLRKGRPSTRP